jgi:hypothetical protein
VLRVSNSADVRFSEPEAFGLGSLVLKADHRMDRNYLKGREGDRANAVLAAAGYNFSLLLRWLEELLRALLLLVVWRVAGLPCYYSAT